MKVNQPYLIMTGGEFRVVVDTFGGIKGLSYLNLRLKYDECKMDTNNVTNADQHDAPFVYRQFGDVNFKTAHHISN